MRRGRRGRISTTPSLLPQFWPLLTDMNVKASMERSYRKTEPELSSQRRMRKVLPSARSMVQSVPQYMVSPAARTKALANSVPR
jgi:hypothetical protein